MNIPLKKEGERERVDLATGRTKQDLLCEWGAIRASAGVLGFRYDEIYLTYLTNLPNLE